MTEFVVLTTARFDRLARSLRKTHRAEFTAQFEEALAVLRADPYNRGGRHPIKKLSGVKPGEGQYRIRLRRFRFRYDIIRRDVVLHSCALRREDTYR